MRIWNKLAYLCCWRGTVPQKLEVGIVAFDFSGLRDRQGQGAYTGIRQDYSRKCSSARLHGTRSSIKQTGHRHHFAKASTKRKKRNSTYIGVYVCIGAGKPARGIVEWCRCGSRRFDARARPGRQITRAMTYWLAFGGQIYTKQKSTNLAANFLRSRQLALQKGKPIISGGLSASHPVCNKIESKASLVHPSALARFYIPKVYFIFALLSQS